MRNGSGTYTLPAGNPVVVGTTIDATWANNTMTDIAAALSGSIAADGQTPMSAPLKLDGGSSSAPSLTFNAEPSVGLYRPGVGTLAFVTGGSERLRIVDGSVIIGSTTNTLEALQVTGAAKITGALNVVGTVTAAAPVTSVHVASKGYVDSADALPVLVLTGPGASVSAGSHYIFADSGTATTATLPLNPVAGDTIRFTNATGRIDHVVARNTRLLFGLAENFTFDKAQATFAIRYVDNTYGWRAV